MLSNPVPKPKEEVYRKIHCFQQMDGRAFSVAHAETDVKR